MTGAPQKTGGPLVVLALAGLDWAGVAQRIGAGALPAIGRLIARGAAGRLLSPAAPDSAAAWATLATGLPTAAHGITSAEEPWAGGLRPTGRASWTADPAWLRLADADIPTAGIAWPATAPGCAWPGVHIDDRLLMPGGRMPDAWPLPPGVAPSDWLDTVRDLRVHPLDVTGAMLAPFVPALMTVDQARDHRLVDLALMVARLSSGHAAAMALLQHAPWQALFVHHRWIDDLEARFGGEAPPFDSVVAAGWTLLDALVGATVAALPDDATIILISPGKPGSAGLIAASGPGIAPGQRLRGASIRDLAPTVFAHFGHADAALPGRTLFSSVPALRPLAPARGPAQPAAPDAADLARVAAFGHAPPGVPPAWRARKLAAEAEMLLGSDPAAAGRRADAALALDPGQVNALGARAAAYVAAEQAEPLPALADRLAAVAPGHLWVDLIRAGFHALRGEAALARPYLDRVEAAGGVEELVRAGAGWMMLKRPADAARLFAAALARQPDTIAALLGLGMAQVARPLQAEQSFRYVLELDPRNVPARDALASLLRNTGRAREAEALISA